MVNLVSDVSGQWAKLKRDYTKAKQECKPKSGQATAEESKWKHFEAMSFLSKLSQPIFKTTTSFTIKNNDIKVNHEALKKLSVLHPNRNSNARYGNTKQKFQARKIITAC